MLYNLTTSVGYNNNYLYHFSLRSSKHFTDIIKLILCILVSFMGTWYQRSQSAERQSNLPEAFISGWVYTILMAHLFAPRNIYLVNYLYSLWVGHLLHMKKKKKMLD